MPKTDEGGLVFRARTLHALLMLDCQSDVVDELPLIYARPKSKERPRDLIAELRAFREFGRSTRETTTSSASEGGLICVPTFVNEFWTARQRAANSLHEISYRACFKPQLPRFFIERLTGDGDLVYDPFMGRGTTLIEAALLGRVPVGCDVNPLSITLVRPRLRPPALRDVERRLAEINFVDCDEFPEDLLAFYHPDTLRQLCALKKYLLNHRKIGSWDHVDDWISVVALNRLTGHSPGFFSVYTMPPNQAVSIKSQLKINERRRQVPPKRDVRKIVARKTRVLLSDCSPQVRHALGQVAERAMLLTGPSSDTPEIPSASVALVVTSPPFLDIVDYAGDNWLRCWFLGVDARSVRITVPGNIDIWQQEMTNVFRELYRVLKPGGQVAFEVGEVRKGQIKLDQAVLPCGRDAGFEPLLILLNDQKFTKTANCWGVDNNTKGTNTNRIVVFRKS